jgi:chromatin remodeling complex protein RSC6
MATKAKTTKGKSAKTAGQGLMRAVQPSADLAAVIGDKAMPRTEVTKKVWDYIKKNGLQDDKNRRMINADAKLKPIFGNKKQVSMFEMTKLVNGHLK